MNCDQCDMAEATGREPDCELCPASDEGLVADWPLEHCVIELRTMRINESVARETVNDLAKLLQETALGRELKAAEERLAYWQGESKQLESLVREKAIDAYKSTGEKKPAQGIGIRVSKRPRYEPAQMVAWCKANAPTFVIESVDDKAISKVAETLLQQGAPVTITEELTATISTDLGKALAGR